MRKSSKALWIALIVVALVCVMALGAMASVESTAVIYGETVDVSEKATFDIGFKFKENNLDVECGKITLTWDSAKMTAESIVADAALEGAEFESKIENGKAVIAWAGSAVKAADAEGELFTVSFAKTDIAEGDMAAIDVAVDNFGYVGLFKAYDHATEVTANKAYATVPTATMDLTADDDAAAVLGAAIANAELVEGKVVTVTLKTNVNFDKNTILGEVLTSAPAGKVVIQSEVAEGAPLYGITVSNNAVVTFYGNIEFKNLILGSAKEDRVNNGLFFPDFAHGAFVEGIVRPTETVIEGEGESATEKTIEKKLNLAGNVTVSSGKYAHIAGNFNATGVGKNGEQVKGPAVSGANITLQGDATTVLLYGGGLEQGAEVTAKSTIKILGGARVTDELIGGARYSGDKGSEGADIYVNTTGTVKTLTVGCLGSYDEAATFNLYMISGNVTYLYGQRLNADGVVGGEGTVINMYIDGGTVSQSYPGLRVWYTNESVQAAGKYSEAKGTLNFYYNKREVREGITYPDALGKVNYFYGGSYFTGNSGHVDSMNKNFYFYDGEITQFYGGSYMVSSGTHAGDANFYFYKGSYAGGYFGSRFDGNASGSKHTGDIKVYIYDGNFLTTNVTGGSSLYADGIHSGDVELNIYGGVFKYGIYGGSAIRGTSEHSGDTVLRFAPAAGKTITASVNTNYHIAAGSNGSAGTHSGNSTLIFKNVYDVAYGGFAKNFFTGNVEGVTTNSGSNRQTVGGSNLSDTAHHTGKSAFYLYDSIVDALPNLAGGSRIDGAVSTQTGDSILVFDASGVGESTVGYGRAALLAYGGSFINGYTADGKSQANHLGKSSLVIKAANRASSSTFGGSFEYASDMFGGSYYGVSTISMQANDTELIIEGKAYIHSGGSAYGGPRYEANKANNARIVNSKAVNSRFIIDTAYVNSGSLFSGGQHLVTANSTPPVSYNVNMGFTWKNGGYCNTFYPCARGSAGTNSAGEYYVTTNGLALFEINAGTTQIKDLDLSWNTKYNSIHVGETCIRLVGSNFVDNTSSGCPDEKYGLTDDTSFTVYTKNKFTYFEIAKVSAGNTGVKLVNSSNKVTGNGYSNFYERFLGKGGNNQTYVEFTDSEKNPIMPTFGQSVEDFLATEGLYINSYRLNGYGKTFRPYADFIKFDCVATAPNAMTFYEGDIQVTHFTKPGEYSIHMGDYDQKPTGIIVMDGVAVNGTISGLVPTVTESEDFTLTLTNTADTSKVYTINVTGSTEAFSYEFGCIPAGTYTLKIESEMYETVTATITVADAPVTKDATIKSHFRIKAAALKIEDSLAIDFKVDSKLFTELGFEKPYMVITMGDIVTTIDEFTVDTAAGRHVFKFSNIAPDWMADSIDAVFCAEKDGVKYSSAVLNYGVTEYAKNTLSKGTTNAALRTLLVDMLNYGAATQLYTGHNVENLANAILNTEELKSNLAYATKDEDLDLSAFNGMATSKYEEIANPSVQLHGGRLFLEDSIRIDFNISVEKAEDLAGLKAVVKVPGLGMTFTYDLEDVIEANGTRADGRLAYRVKFNGLNANQARELVYFNIVDAEGNTVSNTMRYGIACYAFMNQNSSDTKLATLVKDMMKYCDAADAYAG